MPFKYRARSEEDWDRRAHQQGGTFQGYCNDEFRMYTLKKGENAIRILPPSWDEARHYGLDVHVHFGIGPDRAAVLCPNRMAEQPCPICEARARAERQGDEDVERSLRPSKRVLVWVLDRKEEGKGPVLWGMPWTVDRDIAKVSRDKQTGRYYFVDHPQEGFDIYFDREGEGLTTKYTGIMLARRASSVEQHHLDYVEQHPLTDVLLVRTYEEIRDLFEGGPAMMNAAQVDRALPPEPVRPTREEPEPEPRRPTLNRRLERDPEPEQVAAEEAEAPPPARKEPAKQAAPGNGQDTTPPATGSARAAALRERFAKR